MKMKLGLTLFISLLLCVAYCFPEPTNYTATMVMMGKESPYARDGQKIRSEVDMGEMGKMISIVRIDVKKSIMLNPEKKSYFEDAWKQNRMQRNPSMLMEDSNYKVDKVKIGSETIDKHPCIKYTVTITNKETSEKQTMTTWEATDLQNLVIKHEMEQNGKKFGMELKNVKLNAATAEMFEVPASYTKANSMMELMGMGGMKGMPGGMKRPKVNNPDE